MFYIFRCGDWFEIISLVICESLRENNIPCELSNDINGHPNDTWILFEWFYNFIKWPKKYIVYQVAPNLAIQYSKDNENLYIKMLRGAFQIWEYSKQNLLYYINNNYHQPIIYLPFRYAKCLETWNYGMSKIVFEKNEPVVDVFFNGFYTAYREKILIKLREAGLNVLSNYGNINVKNRDIVARKAKVNLILHKEGYLYNFPQDISRIFPLGSKRCFLISETIGECNIESLIQCPAEKLTETILFYINNEDKRQANIENVYQEIKLNKMADMICTNIIDTGFMQ